MCRLLERLRSHYYLAIITTQPYLTVFGIYSGREPPPVVLLGAELGDDECASRLYRHLAVGWRDALE